MVMNGYSPVSSWALNAFHTVYITAGPSTWSGLVQVMQDRSKHDVLGHSITVNGCLTL